MPLAGSAEERLKAALLIELLQRQNTGRYYRREKLPNPSRDRVFFFDESGEQAKDADADTAHAYTEQRGLMHGFRTVRRALGPGVVAVVAADGVFEGTDYYHFGFRSAEACQAAFKARNSYQEQVEREAENKPWQLLVACLEHKGPRRWLTIAAGAFILSEYSIRMPDATLLDAASLRFDTREEAQAAALAIRSAPEYNPRMKLLLVGLSHDGLTEEVVG